MLRHDMNHHEEHNEHRQPKAETLKLEGTLCLTRRREDFEMHLL